MFNKTTYTTEKLIGFYFIHFDEIIRVTRARNEHIYEYVRCEVTEDGDYIELQGYHNQGFITPKSLLSNYAVL
jgi:hypothetical protein